MTIEIFAFLADIVGGIAVVVTLIFFVVEIRRNTDAVRSSTHQQQVDSTITIHTSVYNDPPLADLIVRANANFEELTPPEKLQLLYFYTNYFNMWHFQFSNMKIALFDKEPWIVWDKGWVKLLGSQAGMREVWRSIGDIYSEDFQQHVNDLLTSFRLKEAGSEGIERLLGNNAT